MEGKGLILSNGEFGNRLIVQAHHNGLDFLTYKLEWGTAFNPATIEKLLSDHSVKWLLCCHCETSTGIVVDLKQLTELAHKYNCLCFVDCMSTVGTVPLDLSGVAMATASSGKGLASISGLAIIFSNIEPTIKSTCPIYLDLYYYKTTAGIPFTIPSNLLKALYISARQKLQEEQYQLISEYRKRFFNVLNDASLIPFSNEHTSVFTIVPPESLTRHLMMHMRNHHLLMSYESDYLKIKKWYQLATFGYYTEKQLRQVSNALCHIDISC
jgi:aspartate aminotransferase-like enzyme